MSPLSSKHSSQQHLLTLSEYQSHTHATAERRPVPPKAFYAKRSLVLLLVPFILTGYYCFIWRFFILREQDDTVKYGIPGERWIFYSWFIAGVFALEWSKYGLAGTECAALQSNSLGSQHMVGLLNYSGHTWSGPGGWLLSFTRFVNSADNRQGYTGWFGVFKSLGWGIFNPVNWVSGMRRSLKSLRDYKLWYLLAFLSLSVYVALPLSGLTMELSDGYVKIDSRANVVGRMRENLHLRDGQGYRSAIAQAWGIGSPATLPGIGTIYTAKYIDRDMYSGLHSVPNTLPMDNGLPEMFLAPQARTPVSGKAWGARVSYNCSIVTNQSDFTLLSRMGVDSGPLGGSTWMYQYASSQFYSQNVHGYVELAIQQNGQRGYKTYDGKEPSTFDSDAASQGDIVEYALWQFRRTAVYSEVDNFNSTLSPVIQDMPSPFKELPDGSWDVNGAYFDSRSTNKTIKDDVRELLNSTIKVLYMAPPIGLRCVGVSTFGDAKLDPQTSTFNSFERRLPEAFNQSAAEEPVPRLGLTASLILSRNYINLFNSINSRIMTVNSNSVAYSAFATPQDLQKSAMLAYGMEALQLMYDGKYGFEGSWTHPDLSSSVKDKIITKGEVPALVSVIPFAIWASGSVLLALFYGFRRRRADSLDGFSFYRLGAHHGPELKAEDNFFTAKEPYQVRRLWDMAGDPWAW